ncbi:hypothetical protein G4470_00700 [Blautia faecis]|uniref:DUF6353 family protein n=1 Tax=Blautia faecis TaxID=871665 RepID=UPI00156FB4CC|nr:DUF6353 family protein [Blautia faecis]NSD59391.1 hypothetical protein [Blautia faecis]
MKPKLFFKRNSSTILTVLGCAGVVATAVLSAKAAPKAKRLLANAELEKGEELTVLEKTETVALTYLPVILTGSATIFCICGAQILNQHQQASIGTNANLRAVDVMMSNRGQNGNSDVVAAINRLGKKLSNMGNTYNSIDGVTYDESSSVSNAIQTLTRAVVVEGRR